MEEPQHKNQGFKDHFIILFANGCTIPEILQTTRSPQAVFLSLQLPYNLFHISKTRYSGIIRTHAAGLLNCACSTLYILSTINPIPCHMLSDSPGRVTSAPACHTSYKSIRRDPSSLQHLYLLLMLQLTLTWKRGNAPSWGSTKTDNVWVHAQLFLQHRVVESCLFLRHLKFVGVSYPKLPIPFDWNYHSLYKSSGAANCNYRGYLGPICSPPCKVYSVTGLLNTPSPAPL